ncbi:clip-associating protein [Anaeramoeba flamelloides]|uniref:Clip-associating protein n=1 Tax=Anaeramoeba flamelloides TaxID=1746091 RepID=A0AAV7ZTI9_9EUKA|nr:clip-associating protein [Anaeramoeba flamelloides]
MLATMHTLLKEKLILASQLPQISLLDKVKLFSANTFLFGADFFLFSMLLIPLFSTFPSVYLFLIVKLIILLVENMDLYFRYFLTLFMKDKINVIFLFTSPFKEFIKLLIDLIIPICLWGTYGVPIHFIYQFYRPIKMIISSTKNLYEYKKATNRLRNDFPNATREDLDREDICIFCRSEMHLNDSKKLPCGHCHHSNCLNQWFQQKRTCPTYRDLQCQACKSLQVSLISTPFFKDETFKKIVVSLLQILEDENFPSENLYQVFVVFERFVSLFKNRSRLYLERILQVLEHLMEKSQSETTEKLQSLVIDLLQSLFEVEGFEEIFFYLKDWLENKSPQVKIIAMRSLYVQIQTSRNKFPLQDLLPILCKFYRSEGNEILTDLSTKFLQEFYSDLGQPLILMLNQFLSENEIELLKERFSKVALAQGKVHEKISEKPKTHKKAKTRNKPKQKKQNQIKLHPKNSTQGQIKKTRKKSPTGFGTNKKKQLLDSNWKKISDQIKETFVDSEETLDEYMSKILKVLQTDKGEQWRSRITSMVKLESLLNGGAANYDSFLRWLPQFNEIFLEQLRDLRSQIIKQVCYLIAHLSRKLKNSFSVTFLVLCRDLLNLVFNSKQVIFESGDFCIREVLKFTRAPKVISILKDKMKSKNSILRTRCSQYTLLILQLWKESDFERFLDEIETIIEISLHDKQADCRKAGRQAIWEYLGKYPKRGNFLIQKQDPTTLKNIMNEENARPLLLKNGLNKKQKILPQLIKKRNLKEKSVTSKLEGSKITLKQVKKQGQKNKQKVQIKKLNKLQSNIQEFPKKNLKKKRPLSDRSIKSRNFNLHKNPKLRSNQAIERKTKIKSMRNENNTKNIGTGNTQRKIRLTNKRRSKSGIRIDDKNQKLQNKGKYKNQIKINLGKDGIFYIKDIKIGKLINNLNNATDLSKQIEHLKNMQELVTIHSKTFSHNTTFKALILTLFKLLEQKNTILIEIILEILILLIEELPINITSYRSDITRLIIPFFNNPNIQIKEIALQLFIVLKRNFLDMPYVLLTIHQELDNNSVLILYALVYECIQHMDISYFQTRPEKFQMMFKELTQTLDGKSDEKIQKVKDILQMLYEKDQNLFFTTLLDFPRSVQLLVNYSLNQLIPNFNEEYLKARNKFKKKELNDNMENKFIQINIKKIKNNKNKELVKNKNDNKLNTKSILTNKSKKKKK